MISVVIPTLNAEARLAAALNALVPATIAELVREVIIVDGGSSDETRAIAEGFGARVLTAPPGRGGQLAAGARAAKQDWLLFLHADTVLDDNWVAAARGFIAGQPGKAAVFTLAFDARGIAPRLVAAGAMVRTRFLSAPYGDQGLLISKADYVAAGGFADVPLMEDVDFIRRLVKAHGRSAITVLAARAVTSAARYERDGYARRVFKNALTLFRYRLGAAPEELAKDYH